MLQVGGKFSQGPGGNTPCLTGELGEESLPHCSGALCTKNVLDTLYSPLSLESSGTRLRVWLHPQL